MTSRPPQTVTLFIPDLEMGGAERVFVTLSRQFLLLGHGVRLILARKTGPLLNELDPRVEVIDLEAGPARPSWRFGLRTLWRLRRELRRNPPEAMLSTLTGANLVAITARLLSRRRFPLIVREASSLSNVHGQLRLLAMQLLYRRADRIIALTPHMRSQLACALRLDERHLEVIGNPLDTERIERLSLATEELPSITSSQPYIVALGRLVPEKDYATLIRAAAIARSRRIIIIGDGPQRTELEDLVREFELGTTVLLLGSRLNPYPWLRHAAGFVLCSRWEGYPNALMEAMHFGLPVIVTLYDESVITDVLHHYPLEKQTVVPISDVAAMAKALDHAIAKQPHNETTASKSGHDESSKRYIDALFSQRAR